MENFFLLFQAGSAWCALTDRSDDLLVLFETEDAARKHAKKCHLDRYQVHQIK